MSALAASLVLAGCVVTAHPTEPSVDDDTTGVAPSGTEPTSAVDPEDLPFDNASDVPLAAAQQAALQALLDDFVTTQDSVGPHGVAAAVASADGSWAGAAGVDDDGRPIQATSMMGIGSVTKCLVAAEVLHLAEEGLVDLDAPASQYVEHRLLAQEPTVRQLLSMTSGVPDVTEVSTAVSAISSDPGRQWTADEVLSLVTDGPEPPGDVRRVAYSNSNYLLLGKIIEDVTGLAYGQALRRDLLGDDAGRVAVQDVEVPTSPVALPLPSFGADPLDPWLPTRAIATSAGAAGGVAADAPSLAALGYRLFGGQLLPPAAVLEMTTPIAPEYGLGTEVSVNPYVEDDRRLTVGHSGFVWAYSSTLVVVPGRAWSVAVLAPGELSLDVLAEELLDVLASG